MIDSHQSAPSRSLLCATTNEMKFNYGKAAFAKHGIELQQVVLDITEIQGEDPEVIIRDKVQKAYTAVGQPVIVTDDSWDMPGLNGFPGPYMKSMNHWFSPEDFLRLTRGLDNRQIFLNQLVAYQDELETVVFRHDLPGTLLTEARGTFGPPILKVVSIDNDNGLSTSEIYDRGKEHEPARLEHHDSAWQQLAAWYVARLT